jgi:hypothetical protein
VCEYTTLPRSSCLRPLFCPISPRRCSRPRCRTPPRRRHCLRLAGPPRILPATYPTTRSTPQKIRMVSRALVTLRQVRPRLSRSVDLRPRERSGEKAERKRRHRGVNEGRVVLLHPVGVRWTNAPCVCRGVQDLLTLPVRSCSRVCRTSMYSYHFCFACTYVRMYVCMCAMFASLEIICLYTCMPHILT